MNKFVFAFFVGWVFMPAVAVAPRTKCPTGYVMQADKGSVIITDGTSCPTGYVAAGNANSCLVASTNGDCLMYAPMGQTFTDTTGSYEYTQSCPFTMQS